MLWTITDKLSTSSVPMTFPASWPRTLCFLGRLSAAIGEYDTAIDWLVQARSVSVRAHSTVLEASSLLRTATVYAELREHGRGAETLRRIAIPASRFEYLANRGSQRNRNDTRRFKGITRDRSHSSKMSSRSLAKKGPSILEAEAMTGLGRAYLGLGCLRTLYYRLNQALILFGEARLAIGEAFALDQLMSALESVERGIWPSSAAKLRSIVIKRSALG